MADLNAKAPKVRSGDEINPVLASIIKISALVVIAALIVVITLIIVKFVQRNKKEVKVFEDKIHISLEDFKIITSLDEVYDDISSDNVRDVIDLVEEDEEIYFFFYYGSTSKDLDKDLTKLVNETKVDKNTEYKLFLVDLESDNSKDDAGTATTPFLTYIKGLKDLNDEDDVNDLNFVLRESNLEENPSFIITYNKQTHTEFENPFRIVYKIDKLKELLGEMPKFTEED